MKQHHWRYLSFGISANMSSLKRQNIKKSVARSGKNPNKQQQNTSSSNEASPRLFHCFPILEGEGFPQQKLLLNLRNYWELNPKSFLLSPRPCYSSSLKKLIPTISIFKYRTTRLGSSPLQTHQV